MNELQFKFTIEETNLIFNALAQLPYSQVIEVIKKIEFQASTQINKIKMPEGIPDEPNISEEKL